MQLDQSTIILIGALVLIANATGHLLSILSFIVSYKYGSSEGSRAKDAIIAGKIAPPAAPPVAPATPPVKPPSPPAKPSMTLTGKMSVFGGPDDTGMKPDEGLALYETAEQIPDYTLRADDPRLHGATGLGRQLNPDTLYIACRWDYGKTPKTYLRTIMVRVTHGDKSVLCKPVDYGPGEQTGRVADLSPAAARALGVQTDDTVTVTIPLPETSATAEPAQQPHTGEPLWMMYAREQINFHEKSNNTGIGEFIKLAGFGSEGDPWCAIFAAAMLRKAGVAIDGIDAMAQSFTRSKAFEKIEAARIGAIAVFWRGSKSGGQGHVGFYAGNAGPGRINVLGGNQSDQVMIEALPLEGAQMGLLDYYWPKAIEPKVV